MGGYCAWEVDAHGDGIVHGRVLHTGGYSLWGGVGVQWEVLVNRSGGRYSCNAGTFLLVI